MLAEAIAIEIVCMSTTIDTDLCSLSRFSYNFSAKPKSGLKGQTEVISIDGE